MNRISIGVNRISIIEVAHRYGKTDALRGISLEIAAGEVFALLGPNGSGKTTLFRLLSTIMPLQTGEILIAGKDVRKQPHEVRRRLGIVFQSPSLDKKLTVQENIDFQGALYGLSGSSLQVRRDQLLASLQLTDRRHDRCETLSGGLKRRVEIAKGMLHQPSCLLLDEPSTGLDPAARLDLWQVIMGLAKNGTSILLTTHLLEEAEKADRIAILHQGQVIACGPPESLRSELGSGLITIIADHPQEVCRWLTDSLGVEAAMVQQQVRVTHSSPNEIVPQLLARLGAEIRSITIGRPSLEDLFITKTGRQFHASSDEVPQ